MHEREMRAERKGKNPHVRNDYPQNGNDSMTRKNRDGPERRPWRDYSHKLVSTKRVARYLVRQAVSKCQEYMSVLHNGMPLKSLEKNGQE